VNAVFVDTGYWIALLNQNDELHERTEAASKSLGPHLAVTTEMVLTEVASFFSKSAGLRQAVVVLIRRLRANPNVKIIPQTSLQFQNALDLYEQSSDKNWSLTDCASFIVMRELKIIKALAHDEHFEQAGFVSLLRH
jgi:predicted nucleic acid-binding protein